MQTWPLKLLGVALLVSIPLNARTPAISNPDPVPIAPIAAAAPKPEIPISQAQAIFKAHPQLKRICSCESYGRPDKEPRQTGPDGGVLTGYPNPNDKGACQINMPTWGATAKKLGLDVIGSFDDNVKMALWILKEDPRHERNWSASNSCWAS